MKAVVQSTKTHKGISVSKVRELKKLYGEMQSLFLAALDKAIQMGDILSGIKEELPHGQFQSWVSNAGLPFKMSTARLYMQLYNRKEAIRAAGINGVAEAQKFLSSGGMDEDLKRQSVGVLNTEIASNEAAFEPIIASTEKITDSKMSAVKLTNREQQLADAIVAAGGDRQSAEQGIKVEKLRAKQERERRLEEKKRLEEQKQQQQGPALKPLPPVPQNVYRRFSRLSKQTGRPIADLLAEAADALAKNQRSR